MRVLSRWTSNNEWELGFDPTIRKEREPMGLRPSLLLLHIWSLLGLPICMRTRGKNLHIALVDDGSKRRP